MGHAPSATTGEDTGGTISACERGGQEGNHEIRGGVLTGNPGDNGTSPIDVGRSFNSMPSSPCLLRCLKKGSLARCRKVGLAGVLRRSHLNKRDMDRPGGFG